MPEVVDLLKVKRRGGGAAAAVEHQVELSLSAADVLLNALVRQLPDHAGQLRKVHDDALVLAQVGKVRLGQRERVEEERVRGVGQEEVEHLEKKKNSVTFNGITLDSFNLPFPACFSR